MSRQPLMSVADARARLLSSAVIMGSELVEIGLCHRRVLAEDLTARRTQPPFNTSAMDGYAVRAADLAPGRPLRLVGESAAGHGWSGEIRPGETVRIFTGAPLPAGADTILIQENANVDKGLVTPTQGETLGRFVRKAGLDFNAGDRLIAAGTRLSATDLALAAAMNHGSLPVRRRPRVGILATGDELVLPGGAPAASQIVASNHLAIAAAVETAGGQAVQLGIAEDNFDSLSKAIDKAQAQAIDILVTIGGASVGDHDLVQTALANHGMSLDFWRIAMRPGKPMMFGTLGNMRILGLPGNPVSAIVCALIFLQPLIRACLGDTAAGALPVETGISAIDLAANDERQDFLRSKIIRIDNGLAVVEANARQDSSMLSVLARSSVLVIRPPHAPPLSAGNPVPFIRLSTLDR